MEQNNNFLDFLKVKNTPKKKKEFGFLINKPLTKEDVIINTKIFDKRDLNMDRDSFLKKISKKLITKKEEIQKLQEPVSLSIIQEEPPEIQKEQDIDDIDILEPREIQKEQDINDIDILEPSEIQKQQDINDIDVFDNNIGVQEHKVETDKKVPDNIQKIIKKKKEQLKRKTKKPTEIILKGPISQLIIDENTILERFGKKKNKKIKIKASSYYMNNRDIFINFINSLFEPYKDQLIKSSKNASCDSGNSNKPFKEMSHQELVRDYINNYTPYRGILLYHGLGSGKTCSSVVIAEGMKDNKKIIVMTPASLRRNYIEEIKKCGDFLYRKKQYWEFVDININQDVINVLSKTLNLSIEFIRKNGGAWLVNMKKKSNFDSLNNQEKNSLNNQLDEMIKNKYLFISYNGLRDRHLDLLTENGKKNPFDNAVIIIDEAHNFVSRIVNKISKNKKNTLSYKLYELLMLAQDCRIILLTGTPILNYPNEIAVIFNILRGYIKTWYFKLNINENRRINNDFFRSLFNSKTKGGNMMDYINYNSSNTTLVFTRNPFGFVNKESNNIYDGIRLNERGNINDNDFIKLISKLLQKKKIDIQSGGIRVEYYKSLPEDLDNFKDYFINNNNDFKNEMLFKKRIVGLTSYFRSAQESLMPIFNKSKNLHLVKIPMSDFQFNIYERARVEERKIDKKKIKKVKKAMILKKTLHIEFSPELIVILFSLNHILLDLYLSLLIMNY